LGINGGAGHRFGRDDRRYRFDEEAVRRVLRGLEAGLTEINFKNGIESIFIFYFFVLTRFSSKPKFHDAQNLEVSEAGWYFRQQTWHPSDGGDGFWKMTLTKNGKKIKIRNIYF
jgi:hypothetical protein